MENVVKNSQDGNIVFIGCVRSFNLISFMGYDLSIEEQDERSLALSEVDLNKIRLETVLREGETRITGEEILERLKAGGNILLDVGLLKALWWNKSRIPKSWKERRLDGNIRYIYFYGTILRSPGGSRCVPCLYWGVDGRWECICHRLGYGYYDDDPSVVLVQSAP